jgi:hypothetical protein
VVSLHDVNRFQGISYFRRIGTLSIVSGDQ